MTTAPRVSVIIPTCNRSALLEEAVASVRAQTFSDYEILICDDGSTDYTSARMRACGPPVRYLALAHTGRPGATRNRGVEAARGELIAFLDDDDLWEPEKLALQVRLMDQQPALGLVYTDRRVLNVDGTLSATAVTPPPRAPDALLDVLLEAHFPHIDTVLVRAELVRRAGGFDETLKHAANEDLWFRLARIALAGRVAEPLVVIRKQPDSYTVLTTARQVFGDTIRVVERQFAAGGLTVSQRLRGHALLSHLNAQLAVNLAHAGDPRGARRAALHALRHRPVSSRAWARAVKSVLQLS